MAFQHSIYEPIPKKPNLQAYGKSQHGQKGHRVDDRQNGFLILKIYNNITQMNRQLQFEDVDRKRNYSKIPIKKRMLLVKMVLKKGVPIAQAIQELGLKITTARFIINKYKETGTFPRRKFKKRVAKNKMLAKCKKQENQSQSFSLPNENFVQRQQCVKLQKEVKVEQNIEGGVVKQEYCDSKMVLVYYPWYMLP